MSVEVDKSCSDSINAIVGKNIESFQKAVDKSLWFDLDKKGSLSITNMGSSDGYAIRVIFNDRFYVLSNLGKWHAKIYKDKDPDFKFQTEAAAISILESVVSEEDW